jgi:pyruvate dehydrogenase E1 component alpha subunit/2-oxoisovalerate dehydrogenase E1 component alpha subunit
VIYFAGDALARATGMLRIVGEDGQAEGELPPGIDRELALRMYRGMLRIRITDERMLALQRQGRIGFYGEARGQEAAIVGSAAALDRGDWIVPALREAGAGLYLGMPLRQYVAQLFGNANDHGLGRQLPCHPCDREVNYVVMSSCIATQVPHAVGIAMAMKIAGDAGRVAIGYLGDGATSEGDFHVAANFAGVFRPPVVLFCQNNQWAISTPATAQTASETIAVKALAYGLEPYRVDGNDVFAVYEATRRAAERARGGEGPSFIEALTYRVSAHSSSDDPSRYRDESVTAEWRTRKDPLARALALLLARGWLDPAEDARLHEAIEAEVRDAAAAEEAAPPPPLESLLGDVFEELPWHLREQLDGLRKERDG